MKTWQFITILVFIVVIGVLVTLRKPVIIQQQQWDLSDREHGICAPMYKEGFDWGQGQLKIDIGLQNDAWRRQEDETGKPVSREERGLYWFHYMEDFEKS